MNTLIFLPFVGPFARLVEKLAPIKELTPEEALKGEFKPQYLDEGLLRMPPIALRIVRHESRRMAEVVEEMLAGVPDAVFAGNMDKMAELRKKDDQVDALYAAINRYLSKISEQNLSSESADEVMALAISAAEMENIGDIIEIHMSHLTQMCALNCISFNEEELKSLNQYTGMVLDAFKSVAAGIEHDRPEAAKMLLDKEIIENMNTQAGVRQAKFLQEDHTTREIAAFMLQTDIMENLKRIYEHTKRIGKLTAHEEGGSTKHWQ
ncbi:MAG: Na/Pi cotransporter family protein [Gammaproteobacteria bacterium]|nr:Na/Pi cotransporter family protein [Gammaproteobacteria bacterium]